MKAKKALQKRFYSTAAPDTKRPAQLATTGAKSTGGTLRSPPDGTAVYQTKWGDHE